MPEVSIEAVKAAVAGQFVSGGLLLMGVGAVGAALRKVPEGIWRAFARQTTLSVTINDDCQAFTWLKHWFDTQRRMKTIRSVDVYNPTTEEYVFNPAPGSHWMYYKRRPIRITLTRNEEKKDSWRKRSEYFTISTVGRNQKFLRAFVDEIFSTYVSGRKGYSKLYRWGIDKYSDVKWIEVTPYVPRPLETVLLPVDFKESLVVDIERFKASERWYGEMGIPWHRGYLFYGPPGTGKTSLVIGLSAHFRSKVYLLRLSDMGDAGLMNAISRVEPNSMVVMEDVDCLQATKGRKQKPQDPDKEDSHGGLTLSGLLNVLDGIFAPPGVMFFMTTNHIEKLDPALIRPGRADLKFLFGPATEWQKAEMHRRFFPEEQIPQELLAANLTMAETQEILLRKRNGL